MFHGIDGSFEATRYHSLTIAPESMPRELAATAHTADGVIMGVHHRMLEGISGGYGFSGIVAALFG